MVENNVNNKLFVENQINLYSQYLQHLVHDDYEYPEMQPWKDKFDNVNEINMDTRALLSITGDCLKDIEKHIDMLLSLLRKIRAWNSIRNKQENRFQRVNIFFDHIEEKTFLALCLPPAIKEKFYYSFSHVNNQMRRVKNGREMDDLVADFKINKRIAESYKGHTPEGDHFLHILDNNLCSPVMLARLNNFRNGFNHQITPGIEYGITKFDTRIVLSTEEDFAKFTGIGYDFLCREIPGFKPKKGEKRVLYGMGGSNPVKIEDVIDALIHEHKQAVVTFEFFMKFIERVFKICQVGIAPMSD